MKTATKQVCEKCGHERQWRECHNCDGFIYDGHYVACSPKCAEEYAAFCMQPFQLTPGRKP